MKEKKSERRSFARELLLVVLVLILLLLCFSCGRQVAPATAKYEKKVNAITRMDYSERQKAVDTIVEEGKMNVNYSPQAVFEGKKSVLFNVKNIENNHAPIVFEIYDEKEQLIYTSKQIEPGYEMNAVELEQQLEHGVHQCTIKIGYAEEGNVSSVFPLSIEVRG